MKKNLTMLTISAFLTLTIGTIGSINTNNSIAYASNDNSSKDNGSKENKDSGSKDTKDKSSKDSGSKDTKDKSSKDTKDKSSKDTKDTTASNHKVKICHYPPGNPKNVQEIEIDESALPAHLKHGDTQGDCINNPTIPVNLDGFGVKVVSWREVQGVVSNGYLFESASKKGQFELKSEALNDPDLTKKANGFDALKLTITSYLPNKEAFKNGDKNAVAKTFEAIVHRQFPKGIVEAKTPVSPTPSPSADTKDKAPKDTKDKSSKDTKDKSTKDTGSKDTKDTKDKTSKDTGSKDTKDTKDNSSKDNGNNNNNGNKK